MLMPCGRRSASPLRSAHHWCCALALHTQCLRYNPAPSAHTSNPIMYLDCTIMSGFQSPSCGMCRLWIDAYVLCWRLFTSTVGASAGWRLCWRQAGATRYQKGSGLAEMHCFRPYQRATKQQPGERVLNAVAFFVGLAYFACYARLRAEPIIGKRLYPDSLRCRLASIP